MTPEERQKIYEEEKARLEIRKSLEPEVPQGPGRTSWGIFIVGVFILMYSINIPERLGLLDFLKQDQKPVVQVQQPDYSQEAADEFDRELKKLELIGKTEPKNFAARCEQYRIVRQAMLKLGKTWQDEYRRSALLMKRVCGDWQ